GAIPVLSYPAWHPAGNEIAFISKGDEGIGIWVYNVIQQKSKKVATIWNSEREQEARIRAGEALASQRGKRYYPFNELFLYRIDYNNKGDKITFESNLSGNVEIWVMNSDGRDMSKVTTGSSPHWNPVWSPDGNRIAYATEKLASNLGPPFWPDNNYNIWLADMSTGKEEALTAEEQTDWNPAWSPDGKRIAYVTNRSGDFKHFSIWLLYLK
ncbi:MAG: PD40 domain-containing protein, partial [Nitrospinae bacterium]|nr:PD40 domain-containing protein [Nitrospinota bacterium]